MRSVRSPCPPCSCSTARPRPRQEAARRRDGDPGGDERRAPGAQAPGGDPRPGAGGPEDRLRRAGDRAAGRSPTRIATSASRRRRARSTRRTASPSGATGRSSSPSTTASCRTARWQPVDNLADTLRAVLYVGYKFNDWLVFNSEFEFEHSGFSDEHPEGEAIVEFVYLDFLDHQVVQRPRRTGAAPGGLHQRAARAPHLPRRAPPGVRAGGGHHPHHLARDRRRLLRPAAASTSSYRAYLVNGLNAASFNAENSGSIGGGPAGRPPGHRQQAGLHRAARLASAPRRAPRGELLRRRLGPGQRRHARCGPPWSRPTSSTAGYGFQARAIYARLTNSKDGIQALGPAGARPSTPARSSRVATSRRGTTCSRWCRPPGWRSSPSCATSASTPSRR